MIRQEFDFAAKFAWCYCCHAKPGDWDSPWGCQQHNVKGKHAAHSSEVCDCGAFFFFGCLPSFAKTPWLCFKSKRSGVGRQFRNQKWGADDCSLRDVVSLLSFSTSCTSIQEGTGRCKALSWWVLRKTASEAAEKTFWPRIYLFFHTVTSPLSSLLLLKCLHNDHIEFVTALKSYPG